MSKSLKITITAIHTVKGGQATNPDNETHAPHQNQLQPSNQLPGTTGGRVYVMRNEEVEDAPNVMTGTFSLKTYPIKVLFNSGVMHSFISATFVETLGLASIFKLSLLPIALIDGNFVRCKELSTDFPIYINNSEFLTDLYKFGFTDFDVILGIDWLSKCQTQIDFPRHKLTLRGPKGEKVAQEKVPEGGTRFITAIKAQKLLERSCEGFICNK